MLSHLFAGDWMCPQLGQHGEGLLVVPEIRFTPAQQHRRRSAVRTDFFVPLELNKNVSFIKIIIKKIVTVVDIASTACFSPQGASAFGDTSPHETCLLTGQCVAEALPWYSAFF